METITVMEPVLFTGISENLVLTSKVSDILPIMRHIGAEWNLNILKQKDFDTVKKIIINSVKYN